MTFKLRYTLRARLDVRRLYAYWLDRDIRTALRAEAAIGKALASLKDFPFSFRTFDQETPMVREMLIPFGSAGYIALFEIEDAETITILAVRHQREDDYH